MPTVAMSGKDTVIYNNRVFADLADGDSVVLTYPNEIADLKVGKNGNSIYAINETGKQCEIVTRLIRGSSDDKFLNGLLAQQNRDLPSTILMIGELIKKVGDGIGNITSDTYILSGGIFSKQVEAKSNFEGDTEQSVSIYTMKFSNAPRALT